MKIKYCYLEETDSGIFNYIKKNKIKLKNKKSSLNEILICMVKFMFTYK